MDYRKSLSFAFKLCLALFLALGISLMIEYVKAWVKPDYSQSSRASVILPPAELVGELKIYAMVGNGGICGPAGCQIVMGLLNTLPDKRITGRNIWSSLKLRISNGHGYEFVKSLFPEPPPKYLVTSELFLQPDIDVVYEQDLMTLMPYDLKLATFYLYGSKPSILMQRKQPGSYFVVAEKGVFKLEVLLVENGKETILASYPNLVVE